MFVILDVDGTLADCSHRLHFVKQKHKDWESFFAPERVIADPLIPGVERILEQFKELKYEIVILTGRHEALRDTTMRWLLEKLNLAVPDEYLLMRPNGNMLSAPEFKRGKLLDFKQGLESKHTDFLIIDDDAKMGEALKEFGLVLKAPECWSTLFPLPEIVETVS